MSGARPPAGASAWLVGAQLAAVAGHLLPGGPGLRPPAAARVVGAAGVVAGLALAGTSARALGRDLTPAVVPVPGATLRTDGVYGVSRHPLYAGLLAASAGTVLLRGRASTLLAAGVLAVVLHVKAGREDAALADRFGGAWQAYAGRVPRLLGSPVPWAHSISTRPSASA